MPFVSQPFLASLNADQLQSLAALGCHPETGDTLFIPQLDRFAGTYVLGVQGSGKSGLLQNLITADMLGGHAVIVIDPHGDLTQACLSHVPRSRLRQTYLLDLEDESFPYGVNLFPITKPKTALERTQTVERIMHIFEVLWPQVVTQQYIPLFLPNAVQVIVDNPGTTLVDLLRFFQDDGYRASLLKNVTDPAVRQFWHIEYDRLSKSERDQKIKALTNRLHTLFTGHSLVRNIMGQSKTTINFRQAIEGKQIVFIKLPTSIPHVARLVGTILLAQINDAVFSFGNIPEAKRPGVSLYMDEFQEFATADIEKLFTQGRKFGMRLTIAHQQRDQLPDFLQSATMTARTKICFQLTPDDGREMAHFYPSTDTFIKDEDIEVHPTRYLLTHPSDDPTIRFFTDFYLHTLQGHKRGASLIEITQGGTSIADLFMNNGEIKNPRVSDPTWQLDSLLYEVMRDRNPDLPISPEIVDGFSNCGYGFYKQAKALKHNSAQLQPGFVFPAHLVVNGQWTRRPDSGNEQMLHFIWLLRVVMERLAEAPIGKATTASPADVAKMLTALPKRAAFVRSADTVGVIYTHDAQPILPTLERYERIKGVLQHTRQTYCRPKAEVERWIMPAAQQPSVTMQPVQAEVIE